MQREGQSAWTIQYCKTSILSSIFTALNDEVTYIHPCQGVKIPTVPATVRTIITPEQFDVLRPTLSPANAAIDDPDRIQRGAAGAGVHADLLGTRATGLVLRLRIRVNASTAVSSASGNECRYR
jgi:hypothetical protein